MDHFNYKDGKLFAEDVSVSNIANEVGTPCFIYSRATFERHYRAFETALSGIDHGICYSVKANSNLAVLNCLARLGSGFDIVSEGELERVLAAGGQASKVVFSGVGKTAREMRRALEAGIDCFNVESASELRLLEKVAKKAGQPARIALRVNPNVDAKTHPYISTGLKENKFGIAMTEAVALYRHATASEHLQVVGLDCHIGSQLVELEPILESLRCVLALIDELKAEGITIEHLDLGGGLGVRYKDEAPPIPHEYAKAILPLLQAHQLKLLIEPGRAIAANAGILVTECLYLKQNENKHFAIVDAAMNDLLRPALYQAWQAIIPVNKKANIETHLYDVVGPICETGDFLGKDRELAVEEGDLLAIRSAGAYGFSMSSNYNSRTRAAEVMVDGCQQSVVRPRETLTQLFESETLLPN